MGISMVDVDCFTHVSNPRQSCALDAAVPWTRPLRRCCWRPSLRFASASTGSARCRDAWSRSWCQVGLPVHPLIGGYGYMYIYIYGYIYIMFNMSTSLGMGISEYIYIYIYYIYICIIWYCIIFEGRHVGCLMMMLFRWFACFCQYFESYPKGNPWKPLKTIAERPLFADTQTQTHRHT